MKKYALLCLLSGSLLAISQMPNYDIYDLRAFARDSLTDSVFNKTVDRYSKLWEVRLSPHGDFSRAADAMYEYVDGFNENMTARYASSANWRDIGPTGTNSTTFASGVASNCWATPPFLKRLVPMACSPKARLRSSMVPGSSTLATPSIPGTA